MSNEYERLRLKNIEDNKRILSELGILNPVCLIRACAVFLNRALATTSSSVTTWMGDHQGRLRAVNLCPF